MKYMGKIITIHEAQENAKKRKGLCLSKTYKHAHSKLKWKCKKGHIWSATPDSIKHGSWCPKCSLVSNGLKKRKYNLDDMIKIAKSHNGNCLSKSCTTTQKKLKWECEKGHKWESAPTVILRGSWCQICSYRKNADKARKNISFLQKVAEEKGGFLLSKEYTHSLQKLEWQCSEGHKWRTTFNSISSGSWCGICAIKTNSLKKRSNILEMQKIAKKRGGLCLSTEYTNSTTNLTWQCIDGHIWDARPANIKTGFWCPSCNHLVGENLVRAYLEKMFNSKFPKKKPKWLVTNDGNRLELDGYCEDLGLAFEHQGRHHYKKNLYIKNNLELTKRKNYDQLKIKLCKKIGVKLIVIPEVGHITRIEDLYQLILTKIKKYKNSLPIQVETISLDQIHSSSSHLRELQNIAKNKKGKLLTNVYLGYHIRHQWECSKGHIWETTPSKIKQGRWCHECNTRKKLNIETYQEIAKSRGGKCLSKTYTSGKHKLNWECKNGHRWSAEATSVKVGHWCPKCANDQQKVVLLDMGKAALIEMKKIAKSNQGKCLSAEYRTARKNLKWECSKGHVWDATPSSVKAGSWCQKCYYLSRRKKK